MTPFNAGPSYREKLVKKTSEFIRTRVPVHTRAQYEALLATNQDLAIELIAKWRDLEDLQDAHHKLQIETVERQASVLPRFNTKVQIDRLVHDFATCQTVTYHMEPYRVAMTMRNTSLQRDPEMDFNETRAAFRRYFDEKVVPHLWATTENQLFDVLQITKRAS